MIGSKRRMLYTVHSHDIRDLKGSSGLTMLAFIQGSPVQGEGHGVGISCQGGGGACQSIPILFSVLLYLLIPRNPGVLACESGKSSIDSR